MDHKKEYAKCHVERDQKAKVKHRESVTFEKKINRTEFCQRDQTDSTARQTATCYNDIVLKAPVCPSCLDCAVSSLLCACFHFRLDFLCVCADDEEEERNRHQCFQDFC